MKKKQCFFFFGKNGYHTFSIYENCMTSNFLMATTKIFQDKIEIAPKFFDFFLNRKLNFLLKQTLSKKKFFVCKFCFFFLHNVVLDTQNLNFFSFSLDNFFFQTGYKLLFLLYGMFIYGLINV